MNSVPPLNRPLRRPGLLASTFAVTVAALASVAPLQAAVVLPSVPNGTQYRIVFITSGTYQSYNPITPTQTRSVSYWDNVVNAEADLSSEPTVAAANFHVVGSVFDGATTHNGPTVALMTAPDNIPIYNTLGQLVANNAAEFWSANHLAAMNGDRDGNTVNANYYNAWTPTLSTFRPFGHGGSTFWSNSSTNVAPWAVGNTLGSGNFLRVMGISDAITAVPEPSTSLLGALFALGLFRRRRN